MTTALVRRATPVPALRLTNFPELVQFAQMAAKSALVPPEYRSKPESIMLAVQLGSELGLAPMQSIQNIAVIGSRPAVFGDAMLALVQAHPDCLDVIESEENGVAVCTVKRRGRTPVVRRFGIDDAKIAKLWGKPGPWSAYPARICQMRARGFALRDAFPDVLKGLISAEEARDIPPTIDAVAESVPTSPAAVTVAKPVLDDVIPSLDNLPEQPKRGDAITAEVPIRSQRRPTVGQWMEALEADLATAPGADAVEAIIARPDVQKALSALQNGAQERLRRAIDTANERTQPAAIDELPDWPGPIPDAALERSV